MANASQKKTAAQNEKAVKNLHLGMLVSILLSLALRLLIRRNTILSPSKGFIFLLSSTFIPEFLIYRYLVKIGTPKRDNAGNLLSSGEDLNLGGITEWCFDVLYVTWLCQVGSAIFGERVWFFYLSIPVYAAFKIWTVFVSPMLLGRAAAPDAAALAEPTSKRQQKLKARQEKGDSRVKATTVRR